MKQIVTMRYRVKKSDHDAALKAFGDFMDYERDHPELFHYTHTAFYYMDAPGHPEEELWMFIDQFDDYQDYVDSISATVANDPIAQQHYQNCMALVVPDGWSEDDRLLWTEAEDLRVDR